MIHQNEPPGNTGVTLNGRQVKPEEAKAIRDALGIVTQAKITLKAKADALTVPWGLPAKVNTLGTDTDVEFEFEIPEGRPGIDGHGSLESVEAVGLPFGQPPNVVNFGTPEIAKLRFFMPAGPKGDKGVGIPDNPQEGYVVGFKDGVTKWVPQTGGTGGGTGTGGTTIINNIYNVDKLAGKYAWELPTVPVDPPVDPVDPGTPPPTQTVFDATTYAAYSAAIAANPKPNKRVSAANAVIAAMGTAQKLSVKRNGVVIFTADYSGLMTQSIVGQDVYVSLANLGAVSLISVADVDTGTWVTEISGGTNFARKITLPVSPTYDTKPGDGFNPGIVSMLIPRSMDQ